MVEAGFADVRVSPRMVYVDSSRPELVDGFTRKTFTVMIEGIRDAAIASGLIDAQTFDAGVRALHRTTERTVCSATRSSRALASHPDQFLTSPLSPAS